MTCLVNNEILNPNISEHIRLFLAHVGLCPKFGLNEGSKKSPIVCEEFQNDFCQSQGHGMRHL